MTQAPQHPLLRLLKGTWQGFSIARQTLWNLLFIFIICMLLVGIFSSDTPTVEEGSALVVAPSGVLVEELGGDPMEQAMSKLTGQEKPQTLLRDVIKAVELAAKDDDIKILVLRLNGFHGGGLAKLQDLSTALGAFRESGKKIIAIADNYDTSSYYLAAQADEILLHPMGMVLIEGYGRYGTYYKGLIDKLQVDWNVFKVGTFKSAVEPYIRNNMSEAAKEANLDWMGDLWESYKSDVAAARKKTPDEIQSYIDDFVQGLEAKHGSTAQLALDAGLVDRLAGRAETREYLIELVGEDEDEESYLQIDHRAYLEAKGKTTAGYGHGDGIGVVVASGLITGGTKGPGSIGSESTAALIRKAREDEKIKALVLRVDSPGGSAFASEVILRELAKTREAGKPVLISMGQVAASGGYWISTASDQIWASPNTITGSIGIFGMVPTYQRTLAKIGVYTDGVGTTKLAGAIRPDRELSKEAGHAIQLMINQGYQEFISRVAEARHMTLEEVDEIGQGRVWSGLDAQRLGLVDNLGSLPEVIAAAAELVELKEDYAVYYVQKELDFKQKMMAEMMNSFADIAGPAIQSVLPKVPGAKILQHVNEELGVLEQLDDPHGIYAYSPCDLD